ncbi:MAG: DUF2784 domain-containing protein [Gemmataceae bacterium]|nr:DUF2784 domain-containing protein [Gemmataceae bacterium]
MWYSLLADLIVVLHVVYVGFVVLGQFVIVLGALLRWSWVRNFWFRTVHLSMMLVVAIEAALAIECPMTDWERNLRYAAGESVSAESFVGRIMQTLLFPAWEAWVFKYVYFGVAAFILATFVFVPPRTGDRTWMTVVGAPLLLIGAIFALFILWWLGIALAGTGIALLATAHRRSTLGRDAKQAPG